MVEVSLRGRAGKKVRIRDGEERNRGEERESTYVSIYKGCVCVCIYEYVLLCVCNADEGTTSTA